MSIFSSYRPIKHPFLFVLVVFFSQTQVSQAQINYLDVHPIRVNHKWGYVKIYPTLIDTVIPPKYDFLGDINLPYNNLRNNGEESPYRIFELKEKVGLLNAALEEAIPNKYNRIKVVTDDFFAVATQQVYQLQDIAGKFYFQDTTFENIAFAEGDGLGKVNYFYTKQKGVWGIGRIPNDEILVPAQYDFIEQAGHAGYFKVRPEDQDFWALIDTTNRQVLPPEFEDILVLDETHFAVQQVGQWLIYSVSNGQMQQSPIAYAHIEKINKDLAFLVPLPKKKEEPSLVSQIWNFTEEETIFTFRNLSYKQYDLCQPLSEDYAIKYDESGFFLINADGKHVSKPFHEIVSTSLQNVYKVRYRNRYALIQEVDRDSFISTGYQFNKIFAIKNNLAISELNGKYGVIGIAPDSFPVLKCDYTNLPQIDSTDILLQFSTNMLSYRYSPTEYFVAKPIIYENALLIPVDPNRTIREAIPISMARYKKYIPETSDYFLMKDSIYTTDSLRNVWGRWSTQDRAVAPLHPIASVMRHEEILTNFNAIHSSHFLSLKGSYLSYMAKGGARAFHFFNLLTGQSIPVPDIVGIRPFDEASDVSTFIDPSGKMGIINKKGQELKRNGQAIRYTYIGPFIAGRARACSGGDIVFDTRKDLEMPPKFKLGNLTEFLQEFRIKPQGRYKGKLAASDYYVKGRPENPIKWSYIDTNGKELFDVPYDYVDNFHWQDSTALVLNEIDKEVYINSGKNEAVYGLIDFQGKIKIEPAYNLLNIYKDFYLINRRNTPTFTFDNTGRELLINLTKPAGFYQELAQFKNEDQKVGYINKEGEVVISPIYQFGRAFSNGLALVADSTGKCQFINTKGHQVISLKVNKAELISDFKEGYTWVKEKGKGWQWTCLNEEGQVAFEKKYFYQPIDQNATDSIYLVPMSFSNGLAPVITIDTNSRQLVSAIINTKGNILQQFRRQRSIGSFNKKGHAIVKEDSGEGLIDSLGHIIVPAIYKQLLSTPQGHWRIQIDNGKWGLLDSNGNTLLPPIYRNLGPLSEGLMASKKSKQDQWSYIDTNGVVVLSDLYTVANPFENGYAMVQQAKSTFVINKAGEVLDFDEKTPLFHSEQLFGLEKRNGKEQYFVDAAGANIFGRFFQEIDAYQLGIARVKRIAKQKTKRELYGAINTRGVMIVPPKFNFLHIQDDGNIIINPQRYFGILDKQGNILIEPEYDRIEQFLEFDIFRVERGESVGYVRLKDGTVEWVWELQK